MLKDSISLKSVGELLGMKFSVPKYQRGYRWGRQEIHELLDDIFDYGNRVHKRDSSGQVSKFYCLQPIVVQKHGDIYNIIDGQQRLTTIYILLTYLEGLRKNYDESDLIFNIDFESRKQCVDFLQNKAFKAGTSFDNIDFYHISECYKYINEWFHPENNDKTRMKDSLRILGTLLDPEYNVSVLWYEVEASVEPVAVFSRLNIGKIPLTDAELIKALLLQSDCYSGDSKEIIEQHLFEIASSWDRIEAGLQNNKLWYFLNNIDEHQSRFESRIEFLFEMLADEWNAELGEDAIPEKSRHKVYLVFDRFLAKKRAESASEYPNQPLKAVESIWGDIVNRYEILLEWFNEREIYHYMGFLLFEDHQKIGRKYMQLKGFLKEYTRPENTRSTFVRNLKKKVAKEIALGKTGNELPQGILNYSYGQENKEIINILLLFNIYTTQSNPDEGARFPFDLFKTKNTTSIEHIHPQHPDAAFAKDPEKRTCWFDSTTKTLQHIAAKKAECNNEIKGFFAKIEELAKEYSQDDFEKLFDDIHNFYDAAADIESLQLHMLPNLALVSTEVNSSLNNSFFDEKRRIINTAKYETYIPICTERVFNKHYSDSPEEMLFWSEKDREGYGQALLNMYACFMNVLEANSQAGASNA